MNTIEEKLNGLIVALKEEKVIETSNITDKWHTFGDLYNHRMAFTIALCNAINLLNIDKLLIEGREDPKVYCYKSKRHHNNEKDPMFEGSFIVVIESPGGQISYHYDLEEWDKFKVEERYEPNPYDGHTPDDTIVRLINLF